MFTQLKDLLQKPLNKYGLNVIVEATQICDMMQKIIEAEIPSAKDQIKVLSIRKDTCKISAPPALSQKIDMQKLSILEQLKKQTGHEITNLRFVAR
ncbi:MAG: hypothetical protein NTZ80_04120 [Patescibacteria group bacterium]|nr:hypothetical protein [Patescibacteria group bacterium]